MKGAIRWLLLVTLLLLTAACDVTGDLAPTSPSPITAATPTTTRAPLPLPTTTVSATTSDPDAITPVPTLMPQAERLAIFDEVWQKVDENYVYPDFHGADWNALRAEYRPKIEAAATADQFYTLISDMVDSLKDDHSRYLAPTQAQEEDRVLKGANNYVGIGILSNDRDKSILIAEVFKNSPAEQAGLRRGDRIIAVDGQPFKNAKKDTTNIRGPEGTTVHLTVRSRGSQSPHEIAIVRHAVIGVAWPTSARLEANPGVGYLIIPTLQQQDMADKVASELQYLLDGETSLKGLVIDLRGNSGGVGTVLDGILGQFVSGEVGSFRSQHSAEPLKIMKDTFYNQLERLPIVVLVDKGTESFAEVLTAVLQAQGRARVVGVPSAGNTEEIFAFDLKDGSRLWLAEYGFRLPDGTNLEGRGVIPDAVVDVDWTNYDEQNDPQILKAIELIHQTIGK